ncbi:MAG: hypothetical protein Q9188_002991 [Gyalolechia gomerana]
MEVPRRHAQTVVTNRGIFFLYKLAKTARGPTGLGHCRSFWSAVLYGRFPRIPDVFIDDWRDDGATRGCDFIVYNHPKNSEGRRMMIPYLLCLVEPKRDNEDSTTACEMEHHAFGIARLYTERRRDVEAIFVLTAVGTTARLWKYAKGKDYMDPMFGLCDDLAHRSAYVDAYSRGQAYKLRDGFDKILDELPAEV